MKRRRRNPGPHRIFALSIGERVQWATALTDSKGGVDLKTVGHDTLEDIHIAGTVRPEVDLQEELTEALAGLNKKWPKMFEDCQAVGVSTIGVVDPAQKRLLCIAYKNWFPEKRPGPQCVDGSQVLDAEDAEEDRPYLVDFKKLFNEDLGVRSVSDNLQRLNVYNDVTATALAEFFKQREEQGVSKLVYLKFDEGVNGGIIIDATALPAQLNVELGHLYPVRHERDRDFGGVCPVHGACYEGLASNIRIRKSWGDQNSPADFTLSCLSEDSAAWGIMAYYIAQLCITGALVVSPDRIILGGSIVHGHNAAVREKVYNWLFPRIFAEFERLNRSYPPYGATEKFIKRGAIFESPGVMGALCIAAISLRFELPLREVYQAVGNVKL
jgi:predicted NBD/HSP70 family sugar kinase